MENKMSLPLIMAPLAGITDSVCRRIVKSFGADITYSEMISSRGLWYKDKKTKELLYFEKEENPIISRRREIINIKADINNIETEMGLRWQSRRTGAHLSHKSEKLQQTPEQYSTK